MTIKPTPAWTEADWEAHGITDPNKPSSISIVLDGLERTKDVPGDVVECGVWKGYSLASIAAKLKSLGSRKRLWAFDSFEGLPAPTSPDRLADGFHPKALKGHFGDTNLEVVKRKLSVVGYEPVVLKPGWFDKTLHEAPAPLSLVFLDCDLYESYRVCLRELWPKLSPGGIMVFDEYYSKKYPGARKAIDEYFADKPDKPQHQRQYVDAGGFERWHAVKSR